MKFESINLDIFSKSKIENLHQVTGGAADCHTIVTTQTCCEDSNDNGDKDCSDSNTKNDECDSAMLKRG
jgi:hypothetical protein